MDVWCDECGARWNGECVCQDGNMTPQGQDEWVGMDGHAYVGDKRRASLAYHDTDNCRCPAGKNFDPESWY